MIVTLLLCGDALYTRYLLARSSPTALTPSNTMMHATTGYVMPQPRTRRGVWRCGFLPGGRQLSFSAPCSRPIRAVS